MKTDEIMKLCNQLRETAYAIHCYHGTGYIEKVYENALAHRLRNLGMDVKQQHQLKIYDEDGTEIGDYFADLLIEGHLIVELKACKGIKEEHKAQLLNYLKGTKMEHGLLINFGSEKFFIKKYMLSKKMPSLNKITSFIAPIFTSLAFFRG